MNGWICLHRRFINWEWAKFPKMISMFIHILLITNYDEVIESGGVNIERGQLLTNISQLSEITGMTKQEVRTCLNKLLKTGEITIQTTNKFSLITVCNWQNYQNITVCSNKANKRRQSDNKAVGDDNLENLFEQFRRAYKGQKRGFKIEFDNLKAKYPKQWRDIVPKLCGALQDLEAWRDKASKAGLFVPEYAMLQTWINKGRWEVEFNSLPDGEKRDSKDLSDYGQTVLRYEQEF